MFANLADAVRTTLGLEPIATPPNGTQSNPMNQTLKQLVRDFLILLALAVVAAALGVLLGQWWKQRSERPTIEPFAQQTLLMQLGDQPVLISRSTCPACKMAKEWLSQNRIVYRELVIDQDVSALELAKTIEVSVVPTFLIGSERINGFEVDALRQRLLKGRTSASNDPRDHVPQPTSG